MLVDSNAPSVVAPCRHCDVDTVWLKTVYGGWYLFDASMRLTQDTFEGNRYAVDRRSRLVVDLDCVHDARWPVRCLTLHKFSCPQSFDETKFYSRRPRQANDIDLSDLWRRLDAAERDRYDQDEDQHWRKLG